MSFQETGRLENGLYFRAYQFSLSVLFSLDRQRGYACTDKASIDSIKRDTLCTCVREKVDRR